MKSRKQKAKSRKAEPPLQPVLNDDGEYYRPLTAREFEQYQLRLHAVLCELTWAEAQVVNDNFADAQNALTTACSTIEQIQDEWDDRRVRKEDACTPS